MAAENDPFGDSMTTLSLLNFKRIPLVSQKQATKALVKTPHLGDGKPNHACNFDTMVETIVCWHLHGESDRSKAA